MFNSSIETASAPLRGLRRDAPRGLCLFQLNNFPLMRATPQPPVNQHIAPALAPVNTSPVTIPLETAWLASPALTSTRDLRNGFSQATPIFHRPRRHLLRTPASAERMREVRGIPKGRDDRR